MEGGASTWAEASALLEAGAATHDLFPAAAARALLSREHDPTPVPPSRDAVDGLYVPGPSPEEVMQLCYARAAPPVPPPSRIHVQPFVLDVLDVVDVSFVPPLPSRQEIPDKDDRDMVQGVLGDCCSTNTPIPLEGLRAARHVGTLADGWESVLRDVSIHTWTPEGLTTAITQVDDPPFSDYILEHVLVRLLAQWSCSVVDLVPSLLDALLRRGSLLHKPRPAFIASLETMGWCHTGSLGRLAEIEVMMRYPKNVPNPDTHDDKDHTSSS